MPPWAHDKSPIARQHAERTNSGSSEAAPDPEQESPSRRLAMNGTSGLDHARRGFFTRLGFVTRQGFVARRAFFTRRAFILLLALGVAGCNRGPTIEDKITRCAELSGAAASGNDELRELLTAVRKSGGTPTQLAAPSIGAVGTADSNAAAALADCWTDSLRWELSPKIDKLMRLRYEPFSRAEENHSMEAAATIARFLKTNGQLAKDIADAAERSRCVFPAGHRWGYFATLRYVDEAGLAARIAMLEAVHAGSENDSVAAWQAIDRALRWADWLGRVRRVESRILSATLRAEALGTSEILFFAGVFGRPEAEALYGRLRDTLADWPADSRMLQGDRAVGLHTYEAIRIGLLSRVLTGKERGLLEKQGRLALLENATASDIDQDQANYLRAIALLIGEEMGSHSFGRRQEEPAFYERLEQFDQANALAGQPPALFAHRLLLADVADSLRLTSRDRGRCEVWCLTLASAANLTMSPYRTNPVTGTEYEIERAGTQVIGHIGDPQAEDVVLPLML